MKIIQQIGIFFSICLLGEIISALLPVPFPASVLAMVIAFLFLYFRILRPDHIQEKADFLLKNMAFFFIPAGVGILSSYSAIKSVLLPVLFICVVTFVGNFLITGLVVKGVMRLMNRQGS